MNSISEKRRRYDCDEDWEDLRQEWAIRADTTYLNHGSFGPAPRSVRFVRRKWIDKLDEQPMDFYVRELEGHLWAARTEVAKFVGTSPQNLIFVDNATYGMNVIANSFHLQPGDEVLIPNHEYGAVNRIWDRACEKAGAKRIEACIPEPLEDPQQIVKTLVDSVNPNTRLLVLSHITSATALIMPVAEICLEFQKLGVSVCVDGPHAPAHIPFRVDELGCAFYTASCHKWLCAPLGSGFLYVNPYFQNQIQPPIKSWGRLLPAIPERWDEEFTWSGTRDPSPFLTIPTAIEFMRSVGLEQFQARAFWLAEYAERSIMEALDVAPIASRQNGFYGSMAHVRLPEGDWSQLQTQLWEEYQIEVPIIFFGDRWFIRVSCHIYNNSKQIDYLVKALKYIVERETRALAL